MSHSRVTKSQGEEKKLDCKGARGHCNLPKIRKWAGPNNLNNIQPLKRIS